MRRLIATIILVIGLTAIPALASAAPPESPSCFGSAAADLAQSATGAMGDHSSSFDEPRLGIGNVAYLFTGTHQPGVLGSVLAEALGFSC